MLNEYKKYKLIYMVYYGNLWYKCCIPFLNSIMVHWWLITLYQCHAAKLQLHEGVGFHNRLSLGLTNRFLGCHHSESQINLPEFTRIIMLAIPIFLSLSY